MCVFYWLLRVNVAASLFQPFYLHNLKALSVVASANMCFHLHFLIIIVKFAFVSVFFATAAAAMFRIKLNENSRSRQSLAQHHLSHYRQQEQ